MSLSWYDPFEYYRPSRLLNQRFGLTLEPDDLLAPLVPREFRSFLSPTGYIRPWQTQASAEDVGSTMNYDKDKFQANLDVQQFRPDEITVKVTGENMVTVEGRHEEKQDDHGYISRHFMRKYLLPKSYDIGQVRSKLSSDGILTITAPHINMGDGDGARAIPIIQTGKPVKSIEKKKKEEVELE